MENWRTPSPTKAGRCARARNTCGAAAATCVPTFRLARWCMLRCSSQIHLSTLFPQTHRCRAFRSTEILTVIISSSSGWKPVWNPTDDSPTTLRCSLIISLHSLAHFVCAPPDGTHASDNSPLRNNCRKLTITIISKMSVRPLIKPPIVRSIYGERSLWKILYPWCSHLHLKETPCKYCLPNAMCNTADFSLCLSPISFS